MRRRNFSAKINYGYRNAQSWCGIFGCVVKLWYYHIVVLNFKMCTTYIENQLNFAMKQMKNRKCFGHFILMSQHTVGQKPKKV